VPQARLAAEVEGAVFETRMAPAPTIKKVGKFGNASDRDRLGAVESTTRFVDQRAQRSLGLALNRSQILRRGNLGDLMPESPTSW
jgi:hypothetical protein